MWKMEPVERVELTGCVELAVKASSRRSYVREISEGRLFAVSLEADWYTPALG